ncbi:MAG TPA: Gfo/Idh/MocA family oxidoreductase, partial [Flavisolibacter sp.]|nr:Gfo/Idh/MocA family oxidoreductase [Flavisolibacter sp.]
LEEKEIDIISVCTPNGFHAEHSIKSLQAGIHVLCEKPLCLTTAAAWQMIETEKFCRRHLFVVKSNRYNPLLIQVKKLLDNGKLGRVYSFHLSCLWNRPVEYYHDWHGKAFPDGGTLYTQFSHYIDVIVSLFGGINEVKGFGGRPAQKKGMEFEDTGVVALYMDKGSLGSLHWSVNAYKKNHEIALTIVAEKGTIRLGGEYLNEVQYQSLENEIDFNTHVKPSNEYNFYKGSMSNHKEVYEHLLYALENKENDFANAFDGLRTVEAIEKIYKAITTISFNS